MQCTSHLKQVALASHNFHDVRGGIVPITIGIPREISGASTGNYSGSGVTIWGLLYPFIERQSSYDLLVDKLNNFLLPADNNFWGISSTTGLTREEQTGLNSTPVYFCPSRRSGKSDTPGDGPAATAVSGSEGGVYGPRGDYAVPKGFASATWPAWPRLAEESPHPEGGTNYLPQYEYGPFRTASRTGTTLATWQPRDTMAWWKDGTSNQLIIGEKAIYNEHVGDCKGNGTATPGGADRSGISDCSILYMGKLNTLTGARSMRASFMKNPGGSIQNISDDTSGTNYHWGGIHPGVTNFALGDGSVRAISVTTPTGNNSLLFYLMRVNDSKAVAIP